MANDKDFKVKNGLDVGSTVTLQAYGQGNNTGTAAKLLAVDSSGNLIEEAPSAGGGISNVVEDTTPQLGGNLDVNGNSIVSVSGGDIAITPDANGQIVLDGLNWPISDGTDRQVLVTDGSGELSFDDIPPVQVAATNNTGSSIAAGTPVYQTGVSGQNITIAPADASSASTMPAIGVTKGAISASGGTGVVVVSGFLKGINTSAYTAGDTLYVANGGGFATSPPAGQTVLIENLGKVVKSDASAGSIIVTGAGRANATPNLNNGNFFLGNSSNQAGFAPFSSSVRGEVSATDAGGDGSFSYDSGTGVFTYTGPSATEVRSHFTGGTGVTITNGDIAIGQAVGTTDNVEFGNATLSGYLAGPATFTIDPSNVGDNTGKVVIAGDLQVDGTTTTINSTTVEVGDKNIVLGADATADTQNDGAGITVSRPDSTNAGISWDETNDEWDVTNGLNVAGTVAADGLNLNDNAKAIFGTSGDGLEIFHDGSHSYITDSGTGQLRLRSSAAMVFQNAAGTKGYATFVENGEVQLYHNGSVKFKTASTGVDVTGTVTADGLTVDTDTLHVDSTNNFVGIGTTAPHELLEIVDRAPVLQIRDTNTGITDNSATLRLAESGAGNSTDQYYDLSLDNGNFLIDYGPTPRFKIDRTTGGVSIGTTTILGSGGNSKLSVKSGADYAPAIAIGNDGSAASWARLDFVHDQVSGGTGIFYYDQNANFVMRNDTAGAGISIAVKDSGGTLNSNALKVSSDGNVGIGTAGAPTTELDVNGTITATSLGSVTPTAPTDGQVLTWDNTNGYWEPADSAGNIQSEEFPTVTAGSANVTMSQSYALTHIEVYLNGVKLRGGVGNDYTVSGTTLTFSENLESGDVVCIVALESASTFTISGTFANLTDTSVGSQATNTLIRYNGSAYVPTSLAEDSSGNVTSLVAGDSGNVSVNIRKANPRTTTGTHSLVGGASLYYANAAATYDVSALTVGDIVTIYNEGGGAVTVNSGGSVNLFKDGETSAVGSAVTIAADTIATVTCVSSTKAIITGSGI